MTTTLFSLVVVLEGLVIAGLFYLYPRIARRGLLFGVYVGEARWDGEEARRIVSGWQTGILAWTAVSVVLAIALFSEWPHPAAVPVVPMALITGYMALYLRAHLRARALAEPGPPTAVAVLGEPEAPTLLPALVIALGVAAGIFAVGYAAVNYADLPARVPTHFGPSGLPDAWRPKSFYTVMMLPLLTLVMGVGMGGVVFFIARAKRALRFPQTALSTEAQMRFRRAVTRFMAGIAIMVTTMMTISSVGAIRTGLGFASGISPMVLGITLAMVVFALVGILYLALHYGQGGARLERGAGNAPLTDGLADNRYWVLGVFYVNRDDPSILVERRFGFGYTINFGNWKAVALLVGFIGTLLLIAFAAALKG